MSRTAAAALYQANAEWSSHIARLRPLSDRELADRFFAETQRALRIERDPLGIGRKVEPGKLDIERLVLAGSLTTRADNIDPEFREVWSHCAPCCSRSSCAYHHKCLGHPWD